VLSHNHNVHLKLNRLSLLVKALVYHFGLWII